MPTMSEKILGKATKKSKVEAGDIVISDIDIAMIHDLTGPLLIESCCTLLRLSISLLETGACAVRQ